MHYSMTEARARWLGLARRAEAGEEVASRATVVPLRPAAGKIGDASRADGQLGTRARLIATTVRNRCPTAASSSHSGAAPSRALALSQVGPQARCLLTRPARIRAETVNFMNFAASS
jgi:hypothetical protein